MAKPTTAAATPPTTSAPSPPITSRPSCMGRAVHNAVSIKGAERCNVFWNEKAVPNAPRNITSYTSSGFRPSKIRKTPNKNNVARIAADEMSSGSNFFSKLVRAARLFAGAGRALGAWPLAPAGLVGTGETWLMSVNRSLHTVHQVAHGFEFDVALGHRRAGRNDFLARVVFERPRIDQESAVHELLLGLLGFGLCGV